MNDRIGFDFSVRGPRIVNFPDILQYDYIPLASTLDILLDIFSQAMGAPVEMDICSQSGKQRMEILCPADQTPDQK